MPDYTRRGSALAVVSESKKVESANPQFLWYDVRDWLEQAEKIGELQRVKGADSKLELSAIAQVNASRNGPALLFEDIKGYDPNYRVLTNSAVNIRTFNLTFGGNLNHGIKETVENLIGKPNKWQQEASNYPVEEVSSSPLMENVKTGSDIDLLKFPAPFWHEKDAGRFIGTGTAVITRDPDTGELNVGAYRAQLYDKNLVGVNIGPGKHGSYHMRKYFERGQPMPVVMVFGPTPLLYCLSGSEVPTGISELEYYGAIRKERMKVIKGRVTGLPIPANADIAVEGFVDPNKRRVEGPHGEWGGYYQSDVMEKPYLEVQTLYHRNDPIIVGAAMSKGSWNDHAFWRCTWKSALIYDELAKNGLQNIKGVYFHPSGVGRKLCVISIKQAFAGHATEAGYLASQTRGAAYAGKWVVVVDDDVDPYDIDDVLWAMCSRADPAETGVLRDGWGGALFSKDRRSRGIIFAVTPFDKLEEYSKRTCFITEETKKATIDKWSKLFNGRWDKR